jgi:hypothetical protein
VTKASLTPTPVSGVDDVTATRTSLPVLLSRGADRQSGFRHFPQRSVDPSRRGLQAATVLPRALDACWLPWRPALGPQH